MVLSRAKHINSVAIRINHWSTYLEPYEALSHLTKETLDYWAEKLALLTNEQNTGI